MHRRKFTAWLLPAALCALTIPAKAQLQATLFANGLSAPVYACSPIGDTERLFVVERAGRIRIIKNGVLLGTSFLNITALTNPTFESGFLGMAFHPNYASNGRFFVYYTTNGDDSVVAEYGVPAPFDGDIANTTATQIFFASQPFANHQGGSIAFGPDGKLYFATGDGGSGNDPGNRAQTLTNPLGKILRFDVDIASPYVPADNPFVGGSALDDHVWALGQRNPFRFAFDTLNGDLYIGDVGQNSGSGREEINYLEFTGTPGAPTWDHGDAGQPGNYGGNYGWRCKHGSNCSGLTGCTCTDPDLIDPVHEYATGAEGNSRAIIGGFVYRGTQMPAFDGTYFFSDNNSTRIWSFKLVGGAVTAFTDRTAQLEPAGAATISSVGGFGQDGAGELYILDMADGEVYLIEDPCPLPVTFCNPAVPNSTGQPAHVKVNGSQSVATNNISLTSSPVPVDTSIFIYSDGFIDPGVPVGPGPGNLCISTTVLGFFVRGPGLLADPLGFATWNIDLANPIVPEAQIFPGSTWYFQHWYRDNVAAPGSVNWSDGVEIEFCP